MNAQVIFLVWMTMITAIYGAVILWLLKSVMNLNEQMQYLYSLLEEENYVENSRTQMELL